MPYTTVTVTSASTTPSSPVALSWRSGRPTTLSVIATSISSATFSIQCTLDDLQIVGGSSAAMWFGLSSGISTTFPSTAVAATVFNASNAYPDGINYTLLGPVAAARLTQVTSLNGGPVSLRVMQGE
jgi:hypothetical protein